MKKTTFTFSQEHRSGNFPRSPSPFSTSAQNSTPVAPVVTPSPKSNYNRSKIKANSSQILDDTPIPTVENNGAWRKHGKLFRANIVLADEGDGGNIFALSDSCAIERYYRVADRYELILSTLLCVWFRGCKIMMKDCRSYPNVFLWPNAQ